MIDSQDFNVYWIFGQQNPYDAYNRREYSFLVTQGSSDYILFYKQNNSGSHRYMPVYKDKLLSLVFRCSILETTLN